MTKDLKDLTSLMLDGRYIRAKYWRRAIDNNTLIRQKFSMQKEYIERFEQFAKAAREAEKSGGKNARFNFEGKTYTAEASLRTISSVNNRAGTYGRASFKNQAYMLKKLFPELAEGQELGHKNISVLRAAISSVLNAMDSSDSRRPALKALLATVLEIDKITEVGEKTLEDIMVDLEKSIQEGYSVKSAYKKDVNILSGVQGSIELEWEPKNINQFKGRLAGAVGVIFRDVITNNMSSFEELFKNVDITQIKGSPTMLQDIEKQLVAAIDPKKKQKGSKSSTRAIKSGGGSKTKLKKPKKKTVRVPITRATRGVSSSPLFLITAINKELPTKIRDNMGAPGLENVTGRFASSVRVTDVITTPQGFPSIGYTYMKEPYQTFEPGYAQGSVDRDPRKVIDRSIREIAAQFAIGRFYTRRV